MYDPTNAVSALLRALMDPNDKIRFRHYTNSSVISNLILFLPFSFSNIQSNRVGYRTHATQAKVLISEYTSNQKYKSTMSFGNKMRKYQQEET